MGSGEDREAVAHVADELQQTTRGPPGPGCDRADDSGGIAGPEPESRAQRRVWALAQIGGGAVSGRVSGAPHTEGSAGVRRLRERARSGLKSAATQLQASVSGLWLASGAVYPRTGSRCCGKGQAAAGASDRGIRGSRESSSSSSSLSCYLEMGIEAEQSEPVACSAETARCSGQRKLVRVVKSS